MNSLRYSLSIFMMLAGLMHFVNPAFYLQMMPPWIPAHELMVALSGIAEILLGLALLWQRWVYRACWGIVLLLIAVYPANIYMASHSELFPNVPAWALVARLPFQFLFLAWAWKVRLAGSQSQRSIASR